MCCIMAVKKDGVSFNPYFQNRLRQVHEEIQTITEQVETMGPLQKVPGVENPADICTRELTTPADLMPGTMWQRGPLFLSGPRSSWPLSDPDEEGHIPPQELKSSARVVGSLQATPKWHGYLREICSRKHKLDVVIGAIARLIKAVLSGKREAVTVHPEDWERRRAEKLLWLVFQEEVKEAQDTKQLRGLLPFEKGGILHTTGRFTTDHLLELTGKTSLPIVMGRTRLGALYAIRGHEEDHRREPANVLARVRRAVWLVGGRRVAVQAVSSCSWCRRQRRAPREQVMGKLPKEVLQPASPFTTVALDLFGPLVTKGLGGHNRKSFKTW